MTGQGMPNRGAGCAAVLAALCFIAGIAAAIIGIVLVAR